MIKGIDVSKWQTKIDWKKVKAAGIQYAMIRSSARNTYIDEKLKVNVQGCIDNGISYGLYHVMYATTMDMAKAEARHFLNTIKGLKPTYPVVLDLEKWEENKNCSGQSLTDMAIAFGDIIEKAGYYFMIYANKSWLESVLDYNRLKRFDVWLAQWADEPTWRGTFGLWQNSNCGKIDGITGNVDMDIAYRDYPAIIKANGLNGFSKTSPAIKPVTKPPAEPPEYIAHKVRKGESFWSIAQDTLGDGRRFMELVNFNGLERDSVIHPGDIINIPTK